ncbi:MAG: hypothetical protein ACREP9_17005, partial [Candidatus Dormibacteraceae bacterium]
MQNNGQSFTVTGLGHINCVQPGGRHFTNQAPAAAAPPAAPPVDGTACSTTQNVSVVWTTDADGMKGTLNDPDGKFDTLYG